MHNLNAFIWTRSELFQFRLHFLRHGQYTAVLRISQRLPGNSDLYIQSPYQRTFGGREGERARERGKWIGGGESWKVRPGCAACIFFSRIYISSFFWQDLHAVVCDIHNNFSACPAQPCPDVHVHVLAVCLYWQKKSVDRGVSWRKSSTTYHPVLALTWEMIRDRSHMLPSLVSAWYETSRSYMARAGHVPYFFNFFTNKKWFFAFFIKFIWLGVGFLNMTGAEVGY